MLSCIHSQRMSPAMSSSQSYTISLYNYVSQNSLSPSFSRATPNRSTTARSAGKQGVCISPHREHGTHYITSRSRSSLKSPILTLGADLGSLGATISSAAGLKRRSKGGGASSGRNKGATSPGSVKSTQSHKSARTPGLAEREREREKERENRFLRSRSMLSAAGAAQSPEIAAYPQSFKGSLASRGGFALGDGGVAPGGTVEWFHLQMVAREAEIEEVRLVRVCANVCGCVREVCGRV